MNYTKRLTLNGSHAIKYNYCDYYHILNGKQVRLPRSTALTLIEVVEIDHSRNCVKYDDSGRLFAEWTIDAEPVEELEAWLTR